MVVHERGVGNDRGLAERFPLDVALRRESSHPLDVSVGEVAHVLPGVDHPSDSSVPEIERGCDLQCDPLAGEEVVQGYGLRVGTLEAWISALHGIGVDDDRRVEVTDSRPADAGGVSELQRLPVVELVFHAGLRHPVVDVPPEVLSFSVRIVCAHIAVLITQSCPCRPFSVGVHIVGVSRRDMRVVVEPVVVRRELRLVVEVLKCAAAVAALDVLESCGQRVPFPQGPCPVQLEGVLGEPLPRVLLVLCVVEWRVH